ncbi:response regulator [Chloroflexus sp.]|uniref:response regulator n=1 Tax=Chloroflexus sp. TaxID=1904827 RepID=UPI00262F023B|nr:response regulator [uncultured Chloroflexus sp.]
MSKRILIVDDDPNIRRLVTLALTEETSYEVSDVSSAEAALLHISRQPVDLLLTDLHMPGMSGIELIQRVRQLDPGTAIVVFTISPEDLTPRLKAELQIDYVLAKPATAEQLRLTAATLLDPIKPLTSAGRAESAPSEPASGSRFSQRLAALRARQPAQTQPGSPSSVAMRLTPQQSGRVGRSYSEAQLEQMRQSLKDLALAPDVQCAILADMSGLVLSHWSRRRDINVTVVAALAAGNTLALAEIGRHLGQQQPGHLVIHEGQDQNIIMASVEDLILLLAIGANASLGWARIAALRVCEEMARIARST